MMSYEEFLDEVTTLIYEQSDLTDEAVVALVMAAQEADFFVRHDEHPELRNQERAQLAAQQIYQASLKSRKPS